MRSLNYKSLISKCFCFLKILDLGGKLNVISILRSTRPEVFCKTSQENTCSSISFFNKVSGLRPVTLLKKRLWRRCFPANFAKFIRTPFFVEQLQWLHLHTAVDFRIHFLDLYLSFRNNSAVFIRMLCFCAPSF